MNITLPINEHETVTITKSNNYGFNIKIFIVREFYVF